MIFCPNECIGAGSGEGEGWPDRCATRSTHAGSRFPPFGNRFKSFWRESSLDLRHRLPSRVAFECNSDFLKQVLYHLIGIIEHLTLSQHILNKDLVVTQYSRIIFRVLKRWWCCGETRSRQNFSSID